MSTADKTVQLITFRTYGTWLRGDERGWHRKGALYGDPLETPRPALEAYDKGRMRFKSYRLCKDAGDVVISSLHRLCSRRGWKLLAVSVTETHIHMLVEASGTPRGTLGDAKRCATRGLREAGHIDSERRAWSRGGSAVTLLQSSEVERVRAYILEEQGTPLSVFAA